MSFQTNASAGVWIVPMRPAPIGRAAARVAAAHAAPPARVSSTGKRAARSAGANQCQSFAKRFEPS